MKLSRVLFLIFIFPATANVALKANPSDSIIFRALDDELRRNLDSLVYEDYERPFFISYMLGDIRQGNITAKLGAIVNSDDDFNRTWYARVIVGDYELNDENFSQLSQSNEDQEMDYIQLPVDNDYFGIRRTFWVVSNNTYKSAAKSFREKMDVMEKNNLTRDDLKADDFARVPVVVKEIPGNRHPFETTRYKNLLRKISGKFNDYSDLHDSWVSLDYFDAIVYFLNSEGSRVRKPLSIFLLSIFSGTYADDGEYLSDIYRVIVADPADLPPADSLVNVSGELIHNLLAKREARAVEETYIGPVLFSGSIVPAYLSRALFTGEENLIASREPLYNKPGHSLYYGNGNGSLESRFNKKVTEEGISVYALSDQTAAFSKKPVGFFQVDSEGVIPPDSLVLIENGFLRNLLNDRTPTEKISTSNGHARLSVTHGGISRQIAPGIVKVNKSDGVTCKDLKALFLQECKDNGLDYGIMIKSAFPGDVSSSLNFYRVWVDDGREELIRSLSMNGFQFSNLKDVMSATKEMQVFNGLLSGQFLQTGVDSFMPGISGMMIQGVPFTMIAPHSILIDDLELEPVQKAILFQKPHVSNPLHEK